MKKINNNIGQKIRKKRVELGWSRADLALRTGYSRMYVWKLENDQVKNPGIKTLGNVAMQLGLDLESLWK